VPLADGGEEVWARTTLKGPVGKAPAAGCDAVVGSQSFSVRLRMTKTARDEAPGINWPHRNFRSTALGSAGDPPSHAARGRHALADQWTIYSSTLAPLCISRRACIRGLKMLVVFEPNDEPLWAQITHLECRSVHARRTCSAKAQPSRALYCRQRRIS